MFLDNLKDRFMWAFTSPPSYGVSTNPTQGEHFINDRVDRNDTLVRESGQNTNDARALELLAWSCVLPSS